jgi:putative SOS response-associated peptidase YedK
MCGRFAKTSDEETIVSEFNIFEVVKRTELNFNVAPGQDTACVVKNGKNRLVSFRWGLIPSWAEDPKIGFRTINARAETLIQKPSFARPFKTQRCLIVADGFYEWQKSQGKKIPFFIHLRSKRPFGFAGLYDTWHSPEGEAITTCTIITTLPNELIAPMHDRMPVILKKEDREIWLDKNISDPVQLLPLLKPFPATEMTAYEVSPLCNSVKNNSPDCIRPVKKLNL